MRYPSYLCSNADPRRACVTSMDNSNGLPLCKLIVDADINMATIVMRGNPCRILFRIVRALVHCFECSVHLCIVVALRQLMQVCFSLLLDLLIWDKKRKCSSFVL